MSQGMVPLLMPRNRDERFTYAARSLPFVESGKGRYTHRVREFCVIGIHVPRHQPYGAASCWCGMTVLLGNRHPGSALVADPSRALCATCEGRAIGAGQLGAQEIAGRPVIFSPRNQRNAA